MFGGSPKIYKSKFNPTSRDDINNPSFVLHRFTGLTKQGELFHVQIKENKKSGEKMLLSIFPE
ncbi:MAG: hypothetical protein Q8N58_01175 [bacterium]|nr:hypothetical protein [bacterium]